MKKMLSLALVVCCILLLFVLPVNALGEDEVLFVVDANNGTIKIDISTEFNCGSIQGILGYNGDDIFYQGASFADGLSAINSASNSFSNSPGATRVALVCAASGGVNGELATLTYEAEEDIPAKFDFRALKAFGADGTKLTGVKPVVVMYGDTDDNGLLSITDLVHLKRTLTGQVSVTAGKERNFDLNKNGLTDALDITNLREKLLAR